MSEDSRDAGEANEDSGRGDREFFLSGKTTEHSNCRNGRDGIATYRTIKPYGKPQGIVTRNDDTRRTMVDKI